VVVADAANWHKEEGVGCTVRVQDQKQARQKAFDIKQEKMVSKIIQMLITYAFLLHYY
jgi:hypothetical protein